MTTSISNSAQHEKYTDCTDELSQVSTQTGLHGGQASLTTTTPSTFSDRPIVRAGMGK